MQKFDKVNFDKQNINIVSKTLIIGSALNEKVSRENF